LFTLEVVIKSLLSKGQEQPLNLENIVRELRLMKGQPAHRFYAVLALVVLFVLRHPVASLLAAFATWQNLK
jgi:hypothetical protein